MICEQCNLENDGSFGSGRFCSKKCSAAFSTKNKRKEINERVSKSLSGRTQTIERILKTSGEKNGNYKHGKKRNKEILNRKPKLIKVCLVCNSQFEVYWKKRNQKYCSTKCSKSSIITKSKISEKLQKHYSNKENRKRLKEIGRKGGFGKKGYTDKGIRYESTFEKSVFDYLDSNSIKYQPHKDIPNSTKVSDLYLPSLDLWVELDGINREKKKKWIGEDYNYWLEKIKIYEVQNLKYKVVYNLEEFKRLITQW